VTAVLVEVGRSCGGWARWELALAGSSRLLTCIRTQVYISIDFKITFGPIGLFFASFGLRNYCGSGSMAPLPYLLYESLFIFLYYF
jgi:hypothetical protein